MTAGRLDAHGMIHGISTSCYLVLIATKEYFKRPWTIYELLIAQALNKPIIVAIEADSRHGGMSFDAFVKTIPKPWKFLQAHEFLKIERRGEFWTATINELHKRLSEKTSKEQKLHIRIRKESEDDTKEKSIMVSNKPGSEILVESKYWNFRWDKNWTLRLHNDMMTITAEFGASTILGKRKFGKDFRQFSVEILCL